jgi:hypothetical protein
MQARRGDDKRCAMIRVFGSDDLGVVTRGLRARRASLIASLLRKACGRIVRRFGAVGSPAHERLGDGGAPLHD